MDELDAFDKDMLEGAWIRTSWAYRKPTFIDLWKGGRFHGTLDVIRDEVGWGERRSCAVAYEPRRDRIYWLDSWDETSSDGRR